MGPDLVSAFYNAEKTPVLFSLSQLLNGKSRFTSDPVSPDLQQNQEKNGIEEKRAPFEGKEEPEEENLNGIKSNLPVTLNTRDRGLLYWITQLGPFKLLVNVLHRLRTLFTVPSSIQNVGMTDHCTVSPDRRSRTAKKRLGRFTRFLLSVLPYRLQNSLGYPVPSSMGMTEVPDDVRQSPTKPYGKGSKRKQDETESSEEEEEQDNLVEFIKAELPEEEEEDDPLYEPSTSKSNVDSEELSKNDTESDIEVEEKDGIIQLKENPTTVPELTEDPTTVTENPEGTMENQ
ncbi:uncharacterized protein LOC122787915 [Protopterus annectens]|uniref:uncharacterized protein LOC122787915 n=1 Tax=Protopterus annectens TaxID=7888 RepID=UPI001CFBFB5E|nr:uncharacterized protein LOC122787915 [Protopterus annectens]